MFLSVARHQIYADFAGEWNSFLTDLKIGNTDLEKISTVQVSKGYLFDTIFCKIKHFSLNEAALLLHLIIRTN